MEVKREGDVEQQTLDSTDRTVLSNRSLDLFKQGKFKESLDYANKCIDIAPEFGRGYLRKATALNSLGSYADAMIAAAEGYKCRQSDLICKKCVSQWLIANQALHQDLVNQATKSFGIPTGFCFLSEKVYTILQKVTITRISGAGMTRELMTRCLLDVVKEIDSFLGLFGHKNTPLMLDWIHSLSLTAEIDPQTDLIKKQAITQIIQKGSELSKSLMDSVDPILHPILCPLVVLCVIIINGRSYTLRCTNSDHQEREVLSKSVMPLFKGGVLNNELYVVHHLCTLVGLLESFHGRRFPLTAENVQHARSCSHQTRMILTKLTPKAWEYHELKEICLNTLAIVEQDIESMERGHKSFYLSAGVEEEIQKKFGGESPRMIISLVTQYAETVKRKQPEFFTIDDAEYLLYGSCK